jgi:hypothetical protein
VISDHRRSTISKESVNYMNIDRVSFQNSSKDLSASPINKFSGQEDDKEMVKSVKVIEQKKKEDIVSHSSKWLSYYSLDSLNLYCFGKYFHYKYSCSANSEGRINAFRSLSIMNYNLTTIYLEIQN